jgi:hypothetical protein
MFTSNSNSELEEEAHRAGIAKVISKDKPYDRLRLKHVGI